MEKLLIIGPSDIESHKKFALSVFLAGSIEAGKAREWQNDLISELSKLNYNKKILICNPRRYDWNPIWNQKPNHPELIKQIEWELDNLTSSSIIFFNFADDTMSPISLLELGIISMLQTIQEKPILLIVHIDKNYLRTENIMTTLNFLDLYYNVDYNLIQDDFNLATELLISYLK